MLKFDTTVSANSLMVSVATRVWKPFSWFFADPAPPLSPPDAFLSTLYCPVQLKARIAHK